MLLPLLAAAGVPADAYFGLALMALVLVGGIVMTALVMVRNRRPDPPQRTKPEPPTLPDHPG